MKLISLGSLVFLLAWQGAKYSPAVSYSREPIPNADTTVLDGVWYLVAVLPSDTAAGKTPVLVFDLKKSRFSGNTGCNNMNGQIWFSTHDSSISFSDKFVTTRMACPGYDERAFVKSLMNTAHYHLRNGVLTLTSDENTALSKWMRKPSSPEKVIKT
jgi:heat shock protein HslJ